MRKEQALLRIEQAEKQKQFLQQLKLDKQIEKLLEIMRMQLDIKEKMVVCRLKLEEVVEQCFTKAEL